MILNNSNPEYSIYYIGGVLLNILYENSNNLSLIDLYEKYKSKIKKYANFTYFILSIDWLYLIDAIKIENGYIKCI